MTLLRQIGSFSAAVVLAAALCVQTLGQWRTYGDVIGIESSSGGVFTLKTTSGEKLRIWNLGQTLRFTFSGNGAFEGGPEYALSGGLATREWRSVDSGDAIELTSQGNDPVLVRIIKRPMRIEVYGPGGEIVLAEDQKNRASLNPETGETRISFLRRGEVETYYGFGEKAIAGMSRHGEYIVNWNTDTYAYPQGLDPIYQSIPFFYAMRDGKAYGIFLNNTYRTFFDMGKTSPERYSFGTDGGNLDFFVFTGGEDRSPENILTSYSELTGRSAIPPLWALGNQQSRWSYFPESRVREIAGKFRELEIPLDVIYLDIDYMDGYRVFTWNKEHFPDPKKLISDLLGDGIRTVLIVDPGVKVDENYYVYKDGKAKGVFVKNPDGSELNANVWPGLTAFPDFTDLKAREWFGSFYRMHLDEGVSGFWNDMNEPAAFTTPKSENPRTYHHPDKTFPYDTPHAGDGFPGDHRRYHNVYGMQMARATYEGLKKLAPEKRPFVVTRAGFAGIQRYSAVWSGDNIATWTHLQLSLPLLSNLSVSGVPFIGADVGGFSGEPDGELYTRWIQAAALTPFFRSHSEAGVKNKEPWAYGDRFTPINRAAVELRYRLLPYIYTLFYEHQKSGQPVMRPLWFNYPGDPNTYLNSDQYMVGRDVMVAPVIVRGKESRAVYFPAGDDWRDLETGELYSGGTSVLVEAPLSKLPVFARVGAVIPTQPIIQSTAEMEGADVTLLVIAGIGAERTERGELFQDTGDGWAYRRGGYDGYRRVMWEHSRGSLRIGLRGEDTGFQKIGWVEAIGIDAPPSAVLVNGKSTEFDFRKPAGRFRVKLTGLPVHVELRR